jgi:hypothetical protein
MGALIVTLVAILAGCSSAYKAESVGGSELDYDKVKALSEELRESVAPYLRETIGFGDGLAGD